MIACPFCWGFYAGHGLCIFREVVYHDPELIIAAVCHTCYLVVNLYHLGEFRWLDQLQEKSQFTWILELLAWQTCCYPLLACLFLSRPLKALQDPLIYFVDSLMAHLIMRPEQKFCLTMLRQHYRVIFVQDFVFFSSLASHDLVPVQI